MLPPAPVLSPAFDARNYIMKPCHGHTTSPAPAAAAAGPETR
ncbi:hypothetical protein N177_0928 [Lutibaculum baratangense AMV1]|uniref:Uncharacterized protein n=1 Tax=Lutibaculum baratangense AMV1 TaxID=631454 RepID=V4TKT1_9HYPH|nr:hypothetical protein N177_0928 [Lutibaculum baratangense AMV1]